MRRIYKSKSKNCPLSDDFLEGFNSGTDKQFEADIEALKRIRDKVKGLNESHLINEVSNTSLIDVVIEIIDGEENK